MTPTPDLHPPLTDAITFLFTDIEGSTTLWEQHPEAMKLALAKHDALLRRIFEAHEGHIFKTVGDAFCVAFESAANALLSAIESQQALQNEAWGEATIKVRMALHCGEAEARDNDYFGQTLNRVARLLAAGHGGQVLVSTAIKDRVAEQLPQNISLRDMGERRLKDLIRPEHIYQLVIPKLQNEFVPLKTLDVYRHNLPIQLSNFIGREKEIGQVKKRLEQYRLVTLIGSGGIGKTRLSLQVASELLDVFPQGVLLVELAALADPELVTQTVAGVMGLQEEAGRALVSTLIDHLRGMKILFLLDNCEHLIQASAQLVEALMRSCPDVHILATSREVLDIEGEVAVPVSTLAFPDLQHPIQIDSLIQYESVRLFMDRAVLASPGFAVTNDNAPAVVQVCRRLDGIPLAIELAAARVKLLRVEQIAERLDDRFQLLTGGRRTSLPRHQTLAALIDWSYELLSDPERIFFRQLSVFAGGWTLEAAEAVCRGDEIESTRILDLLTQLVNKSLILVDDAQSGTTRYRMLETIYQYALTKLAASGEAEIMRRRHATYYLALAEAGGTYDLTTRSPQAWHDQMAMELDNLRTVLGWSQSATGDPKLGLHLAGVTAWFWVNRGLWSEGRGWLEGALAQANSQRVDNTQIWAAILFKLGYMCTLQGDYITAEVHFAESLKHFQELGDITSSAFVLSNMGWQARERGDMITARLRLDESLTTFRKLGDKSNIAGVLNNLGEVLIMQEDAVGATRLLEEGLTLFRELGETNGIGWALNHLGHAAQIQGNYEQATQLHEESLSEFRELGQKWLGIPWAYQGLGETALAHGKADLAATHLTEALGLFYEYGDRAGTSWCLAGLAGVAALNKKPERAAWLWGAAEAFRQSIGARPAPAARATHERLQAEVRKQLGEETFNARWTEAQSASMEQAIAEATR